MTSCLDQNTFGCIHKDNGQICKRSSNGHVTGILLMTRSICHDKASLFCGEITICHINRDSLLTLCHKTIQQQRIIDCTTGTSHFTIKLQCLLLICKDQLGIIKHMSDQCGLSIIYTTASNKFQ